MLFDMVYQLLERLQDPNQLKIRFDGIEVDSSNHQEILWDTLS